MDPDPQSLPPPPELKPGDRIGAYTIIRLLGEGGMGQVYLARDAALNRDVAIKVFTLKSLRDQPLAVKKAFRQRFVREARLAGLISHPNVVQVFHAALDDEPPHFVMEYLRGETLDEIIAHGPRLANARICRWGLQICHALRFAWENYQVIHRDLKPNNIMILEDDRLKLLDLGIAKMVASHAGTGAQLTTLGQQVGSPYYMAPEQQVGEPHLDHRCDIFALGIILCRLITQRPPYEGETDQELHQAKLAGPSFKIERAAPHAPVALVDLIYRMLEPNREDRLDSYREIEDVLEDCLEGFSGHQQPRRSRVRESLRERLSRDDLQSELDPSASDSLHVSTLALSSAPPELAPVIVDGVPQTPSGIIIEDVEVFLPQMRQLLQQIEAGMVLGDYQIMELIGFGGMGAVYRGIHTPRNEPVAIKFLIGDDKGDLDQRVKRFRLEAEIISRLQHPSIVRVRDLQQRQGLSFMVMDLFLGLYGRPVNLKDYCCSFGIANGLLDEEDLQQITLALLEAIAYAHENDVVHCDIKPENVLFQCLDSDDEDGYWDAHLKLTDFGLAKIVGESLVLNSATRSMRSFAGHSHAPQDAAALIGTYDYMSPEQRRGEPATPISDLFSIGMLMLRLLTGVNELGLRNKPSSLRKGIHKAWDKIILTALREKPSQRFPDADTMAQAIAEIDLSV